VGSPLKWTPRRRQGGPPVVVGPSDHGAGTGRVAHGRTPSRFERGGRPASGCERCDPRPRTSNSRGSRRRRTVGLDGRCTACRSGERGGHSGPRARGGLPAPPARPTRTAPRCDRPRPSPSGSSGAPYGPRPSRLRLLAYWAVDRRPRDQRRAADAVLRVRGGRHRADRPRDGRGWGGVRRRRCDCRTERGGGRKDRAHGACRGGRGRSRGSKRSGGGRAIRRLGEGEAALAAEQRPVGADLAAVEANGHARRNVNSLKRRRVDGETPVGRDRHPGPGAVP